MTRKCLNKLGVRYYLGTLMLYCAKNKIEKLTDYLAHLKVNKTTTR